MGLLDGKTLLITGVLTRSSIAFHVARLAQQEGAQVILTSFGRAMRITPTVARRLAHPVPILELDVTDEDHLASLAQRVGEHTERLDGVVHSIAYAPPAAFDFPSASWPDVSVALHVSAYSLKALTLACLPVLADGGAVVGLTLDSAVTWPAYGWMGVAKAAFEATNRYLARDLGPRGIRCNLVAAGPIRTAAAGAIPDSEDQFTTWGQRAPLGWDPGDAEPAARACLALLSDWFPATTGQIVHVDGGLHITGM